MPQVRIFDPPMCCSTGVCGPSVDPLLAAFAADVDWLKSRGIEVARYNLAQDPQPFVAEPVVSELLQREGDACLPLVLINGDVLARGVYPRREDLARAVGLAPAAPSTKRRIRLSGSDGCTPGSGCC